MTGAMTQLGYLSSYATELFQDLFELSDGLHKRVQSATQRTAQLLQDLPAVEQAVADADSGFSQLLEPKQDIHVEQEPASQLFVPKTVPASIAARYASDDCHPPPDFSLVETAMTDSEHQKFGICEKQYSDPQFFFSEWERQEEARLVVLMEARAQKKAEKKARRAKEKALKEKERGLQKTVTAKKQLNWRNRYAADELGNVKVTAPQQNTMSLVQVSQISAQDAQLGLDQEREVTKAMRGNRASMMPPAQQSRPTPPPRPASNNPAPPPKPTAAPAPVAGGSRPPPPPRPGKSAPPAAEPMPEPVQENYVPEIAAPTPAASRPPPPPKPAPVPVEKRMPKGALDMSVLGGIKGGVTLKKAAPIQKRVDPKMNLLASIKKGGALKHVDVEEVKAQRKASVENSGGGGMFGGGGINKILERRKFLAEESESDSSDEDWD